MTINEYQAAALRKAQTNKFLENNRLLNAALGLCTENDV